VALTPTDILKIQSAIDRYEKRFPGKPSPSAEDALAWQAGKRRRESRSNAGEASELSRRGLLYLICRGIKGTGRKYPRP
jgi:hypothetical protein